MKRTCEHGSILLETALVIPLYLALLSGIFWIGDLALLRSKSTFFDRFAAWSSGTRHFPLNAGNSKNILEGMFLKPENVGAQRIENIRNSQKPGADNWSAIRGSAATVSIEPPAWTVGWRKAALTMMETRNSELRKTSFHSREMDASKEMHRNLMRAENQYREKVTPQTLAEKMEWVSKIYYSPWPTEWTEEKSSSIQDFSPCMKYERHKAFVQWSE